MQLSSTPIDLSVFGDVVDSFVSSVDVLAMSGSDAAAALSSLAPLLHKLAFLSSSLGAHAVASNHHNEVGARSGAAWLGSALGVSERVAAQQLGAIKAMDLNPDVGDAVTSGSLSFAKASLIARMARCRVSITEELMAHAHSDSYESLKRRALDLDAKDETSEERKKRIRASQYIHIEEINDDLVGLNVRLLRSGIATWLAGWRAEEAALRFDDGSDLPRSAVVAEAFAKMLSRTGASSKVAMNYHIDLEDWQNGWPTSPEVCELAGVGLVPVEALRTIGEHPAIRLLISSRNKLLWYSESTYKPKGELPEYIKRAVKAHQRHRCAGDGCVGPCDEVDHELARTNSGQNDFSNLQSLCKSDHDAKTKRDAPWTAGGIYGKRKQTSSPLADTG